jgi:hypothetical protein
MTRTAAAQLTTERITVLVGRLREAWNWTDHQLEPGPTRYVERTLTDTARARLDQLVAAERRDRVEILRHAAVPKPNTPAPLRTAVADARAAIHRATDDAAWLVASAARHATPNAYRRTGTTTAAQVAGALDYLGAHLVLVDAARTLEQIERDLGQADHQARTACGVGTDRRLIKAECPACGRRSLAAEIGSPKPDEWAILCVRPDCRCRGAECACKRPVRYPGPRHIWPEKEWAALGKLLNQDTP